MKELTKAQKEQQEAMKVLLGIINTKFSDFQKNSRCLNNKSAARRSRKISFEIQLLLKDYRSVSIK